MPALLSRIKKHIHAMQKLLNDNKNQLKDEWKTSF